MHARRQLLAAFADHRQSGRPLARRRPAVGRHRYFGAVPGTVPAAVLRSIREGLSTLVAAPTGSGKTLTAFLAAIDALVVEGLAAGGELADATQVVYVSPLKALSNDIRINLEQPLAGIREELARLGLPDVDIRSAVRTGDTPQVERGAMRKRPPHILVTTPESLYILLGSESGRQMLAGVRSVIVDEIDQADVLQQRVEVVAVHRGLRQQAAERVGGDDRSPGRSGPGNPAPAGCH